MRQSGETMTSVSAGHIILFLRYVYIVSLCEWFSIKKGPRNIEHRIGEHLNDSRKIKSTLRISLFNIIWLFLPCKIINYLFDMWKWITNI